MPVNPDIIFILHYIQKKGYRQSITVRLAAGGIFYPFPGRLLPLPAGWTIIRTE